MVAPVRAREDRLPRLAVEPFVAPRHFVRERGYLSSNVSQDPDDTRRSGRMHDPRPLSALPGLREDHAAEGPPVSEWGIVDFTGDILPRHLEEPARQRRFATADGVPNEFLANCGRRELARWAAETNVDHLPAVVTPPEKPLILLYPREWCKVVCPRVRVPIIDS